MKFKELYEKYLGEASVLDPIRPSEMKRTKSGHDRKTSFRTPVGNKISVIFKEYPNNEAGLSFKVNSVTSTDDDKKRPYDKDIARMVLWVVREELKDSKYTEVAINPEYDDNDPDGLKRKKAFITMIKRYITNYEIVDYDDEGADFTMVPKNLKETKESAPDKWMDKLEDYDLLKGKCVHKIVDNI